MEADKMAVCPKCKSNMQPEDGKMRCSCGYQYDLPRPTLSYAELLAENIELKKKIKELKLLRG